MSPMKQFCCKSIAKVHAYVSSTRRYHKPYNTATAGPPPRPNVTLSSLPTKSGVYLNRNLLQSAVQDLGALNQHNNSATTRISLRRQLSFLTCTTFPNSLNQFNKYNRKMTSTPAVADLFQGSVDRFRGVTVDGRQENVTDTNDFLNKLHKSLEFWKKNKNRAIWFHVYKEQSHWVPILNQAGFDFHHARVGVVTMCRWLPTDESYNIPEYAHTLLGCGGVVINANNEVLVVSDRFAMIKNSWKLPGGYVEPKENIVDAVIREVREETGIDSTFHSIICIRHSHNGNFGCSDLYVVVGLEPKNLDLKRCEREIAKVQWMPINEYLEHKDVHETNRHFVRTYLDYKNRGLVVTKSEDVHKILKKPFSLYYIEPEKQQ